MPTTTKMGIVYPSSTDLVKDGATAMGTISTTVDAKTGLVLLNTTSFTTVSSTSSAANTFSSTYDYYIIEIALKQNTTNGIPRFTYRASGTDITTGYYFGGLARNSAAATIANDGSNIGFVNLSTGTLLNDGGLQYIRIELSNPNQTGRKLGTSQAAYWDSSSVLTGFYTNFVSTAATAADAFTITASAGTITGSYSVFGVNK